MTVDEAVMELRAAKAAEGAAWKAHEDAHEAVNCADDARVAASAMVHEAERALLTAATG